MSQREHLLVRAAFKQEIERTPVWVMRQAGRYLKEYREVREKAGSFLNLCMHTEMAAEVSIQPLDLIGVDAVIMFSDILTPLIGMGMDLNFDNGPKFNNPVRNEADIDALKLPDPDESTPYVGSILRLLRSEIKDRAPVIGFAGAPFTLASYMVEGGSSKLFQVVKTLFFNRPDLARKLMKKLTRMTIDYLNYQIENGAQMVQLFDTWAGIFSVDDFREFIFPSIQEIFAGLNDQGKVPRVYYINGGHHLLKLAAQSGADVVGLDWRPDLGETKRLIGDQVALQGNLDPNVLFCEPEVIKAKVKEILDKFGPQSGHIFNLGHGIDKEVNPDHLRVMVQAVKDLSVR
ncbi:MAG: uroporphyrinogen decarboxylase [Deltaproteobacteria bacterium]|nr:uroporphyrinogen decarboxylase [Deltaproteobacteria bacterium]